MAPKNAEVINNLPMGSSCEEEESGSSGEESKSSAEDSKKDKSKLESDSEGESDSVSDSDSKPAKKNKQPAVTGSIVTLPESSTAKSKLESDSEGESDSDSDSEPAKKNKQSVVTSGSAVALPESASAKRPLEQAESEANKKLKTSATEHVKNPKKDAEVKKISGDEAKKMFQRLFSETDEIALLQSVLDFTSSKRDPYEESDAFCIYVKKLIEFNATKIQIGTKLQRLKKKFNNTVKKALKKGKSEDEIVFAKDLDQKAFELSRKIWGENGVLASKSRRKLGETPKDKKLGGTPKEKKLGETPKEMKLKSHSSPNKQQEETEKPTAKVVNTSLSIGREIASFFNAENSSVSALDETTIAVVWEKVADGAEKREVEEKWKKLKAKQVELCLQRTELVNETAKMIFKAYES